MKLNLKDIQSVRSIRKIDERLVSYNIEMAEVTGGSFWKAYTSAQIAGIEEFPPVSNIQNLTSTKELMQYYPPLTFTMSAFGSWQKDWGLHGSAFLVHGLQRLIMILKE